MISINEQTVEIVEEMMSWEEELKVKTHTMDNGATVIDCGVNVDGSIEAGLMFTEVCMGGLATTSVSVHKIGDVPFPFIDVTTDHPSIACLASQKAGWSVSVGDYFAMGSGPARALALKPKHTYERINYKDESEYAVIALESATLPGDDVLQHIADECSVDVGNVYALVAPTASIVGSVQVSGRVVETGIYKLNELKFDTTKIVSGSGTAPIAPVMKSDLKAMGTTNDSVIYYGSVALSVHGVDEELFKKVPSSKSKDYGKPFFNTFKEADYDFYKIDTNIFAPAEILANDLDTGAVYHTGHLNTEVILESYGVKGI